eukprot:jgi/Mesen1/6589/ME000338S05762
MRSSMKARKKGRRCGLLGICIVPIILLVGLFFSGRHAGPQKDQMKKLTVADRLSNAGGGKLVIRGVVKPGKSSKANSAGQDDLITSSTVGYANAQTLISDVSQKASPGVSLTAQAGDDSTGASSVEEVSKEEEEREPIIQRLLSEEDGPLSVEEGGRVAICLVGEARDFELTGPSIERHLLSAYPNSDVFVNMPFDESTRKLSLFANLTNLVHVRIFPSDSVNESAHPVDILRHRDSPSGLQGLLQYFRLVEGCIDLIKSHEQRHSLKYSWIVRTRVDGFWAGPPPDLKTLDPHAFTIPYGQDWVGYNDRFGIGGRRASLVAMSRLSLLPALQRLRYRDLNSETSHKAQFDATGISVARANVSFCILTRRFYPWKDGPPIPSMGSSAPLNGAKCRPCTPRLTGTKAVERLRRIAKEGSTRWLGPALEGIDLCDASGKWELKWQHAYVLAAGKEQAARGSRLQRQPLRNCTFSFEQLRQRVQLWYAPRSKAICRRGALGKLTRIGREGNQWGTFLDKLHRDSVVYSVGVDQDLAWARHLVLEVPKITIHAIDGSPTALAAVRMMRKKSASSKTLGRQVGLPPGWTHHPWIITYTDGTLNMAGLALPKDTEATASYTLLSSSPWDKVFTGTRAAVQSKQLNTTMAALGHRQVDLLKLDVEGYETVLLEGWIKAQELAVCQLLIKFAKPGTGIAWGKKLNVLKFQLNSCVIDSSSTGEKCTFFSSVHC